MREAELMGGERQFSRIAGEVALKFGVRFDHNMIFDVNVPENELIVAVIAVANAAILWTRLDRLFGEKRVHHNKKVRGSSDEWAFDAAVDGERGLTLFEVVPPNANAVNGAVTKFLDLRDLGDEAPARVAVVTSKA